MRRAHLARGRSHVKPTAGDRQAACDGAQGWVRPVRLHHQPPAWTSLPPPRRLSQSPAGRWGLAARKKVPQNEEQTRHTAALESPKTIYSLMWLSRSVRKRQAGAMDTQTGVSLLSCMSPPRTPRREEPALTCAQVPQGWQALQGERQGHCEGLQGLSGPALRLLPGPHSPDASASAPRC